MSIRQLKVRLFAPGLSLGHIKHPPETKQSFYINSSTSTGGATCGVHVWEGQVRSPVFYKSKDHLPIFEQC